jgi:hypothetical protein
MTRGKTAAPITKALCSGDLAERLGATCRRSADGTEAAALRVVREDLHRAWRVRRAAANRLWQQQ